MARNMTTGMETQKMEKYPQVKSLKEDNLLFGKSRTFGIYQIRDDSPGENYAVMNKSFIESHGMQIQKEDYELVYVGELVGNMTLEDIFEKFNIDHPQDFRGHSLSVSDIVVLNDGEKVTAYFVDSMSFVELDNFLNLEEQTLDELAYQVGKRYFAIQTTEEGYDYSFYDEDFRLMDGGIYENEDISIEEAAEELLKEEGWLEERVREDYDQLMEKVEEIDEVVIAEIQKIQGEYKPLAKVEELEEANYNMIDNVLNNMPPKKEPYLEYFAAECDEYHSLGNIYKSTNLDEIIAKYWEIIDDPTLSYYGNGMGIIYHDPNDKFYDEEEVSLVNRKTIRGDSLDDVEFLAALPMVHEALEKIVEAFPDFRYYPPKELDIHYFPEKMNADELAIELEQLAKDFDHYDYHDNFSTEEDMVETVALELRCGYAHRYIPFLKDIIDEECEESPRAEELLKKLKGYQPEILETAVPVVRIDFCEDKEMEISGYQKLESLNEITAKMDADLASKVDPSTGMPEKTVQMYFTIYYPDHDQMQELKGKIYIGDGNGGIVSQLKIQNEMKLYDES